MSAVATAIIGGAVVGGIASNSAANKGADAATAANNAALSSQERLAQQQIDLQQPFYDVGVDAIDPFRKMLGLDRQVSEEDQAVLDDYANWELSGNQETKQAYDSDRYIVDPETGVGSLVKGDALNPEGEWWGNQAHLTRAQESQAALATGGAGDAPDLSPLAQWELQQGNQALGRAEAARGLSGSGGAARRQGDMEMGVAARDYTNSYNRILDALKLGTGASGAMGNALAGQSQNVGQTGANNANLQMQTGQNNANLWAGMGALPGEAVGAYNAAQPPPQTTTTPNYVAAPGQPGYQAPAAQAPLF